MCRLSVLQFILHNSNLPVSDGIANNYEYMCTMLHFTYTDRMHNVSLLLCVDLLLLTWFGAPLERHIYRIIIIINL